MSENPTSPSGPADIFNLNAMADFTQGAVDRFLDAAAVDAVYGEPVVHEGQMIIPTAEVISVLGVGYGGGGGSSESETENKGPDYGSGGGGGGGGRIFSRPAAIIVADASGVRVEPVVDVTKLGLAALTAFGFMIGMFFRMRGAKHLESELRQLKDLG
ncbi:MAG TPA: spore germination protein GerW family protein [Anaerolineaceae bacterium]